MAEAWLLALACAGATYLWRGLGVLLSGRIRVESEIFNWVACVAYAMLAGLISRMIVMPTGMLAGTALAERLTACAVALAAYYVFRRNLLVAVLSGAATLMAIAAAPAG